jgi:hypothetical protein
MEDIRVITVATRADRHFHKFKASWNRFGVDPVLLGWGQTFLGFGCKLKWLAEYLEQRHEFKYLLFCDAFDTVTTCGPNSILENFQKLASETVSHPGRPHAPEIIFSAERNCWPDADRAREYPSAKSPYRFLNSGLMIGLTSAFRQLLERGHASDVPPNGRDQATYTDFFLRQTAPISLDYDCRIFQSLWGSLPDVEWHGGKQAIRNRITGEYPLIFHGNGNTDMTQVLQWLRL